jgi:hypothetical protein
MNAKEFEGVARKRIEGNVSNAKYVPSPSEMGRAG